MLVGTAGFEPTTPCLPDKCATRLRYAPIVLVGVTGIEPATFCSRSRRATKLRYTPLILVGTEGLEPSASRFQGGRATKLRHIPKFDAEWKDLNLRPSPPSGDALPTALHSTYFGPYDWI